MSIGEKIITAVGPLVTVYDTETGKPFFRPVIFVWSPVAEEQFEAVVDSHIAEQVKQRIAAFKQGIADGNIDPFQYPAD